MQYKPLLSEVKVTSTYSSQKSILFSKKLKVKKKEKKEIQMLEIWKMKRYICSSQTKHPNYLNSADVLE